VRISPIVREQIGVCWGGGGAGGEREQLFRPSVSLQPNCGSLPHMFFVLPAASDLVFACILKPKSACLCVCVCVCVCVFVCLSHCLVFQSELSSSEICY